jgi:preprotein translocase subunit SecG
MLFVLILILHILVSILLIGVVLLQSGRGGGLAGAFGGGGGNQTLFGGRGASTFLSKATWILGGAFMFTSLILAFTVGRQQGTSAQRSLLRENPIEAPAPATGAPGTTPAPVPGTPETPTETPSGGN